MSQDYRNWFIKFEAELPEHLYESVHKVQRIHPSFTNYFNNFVAGVRWRRMGLYTVFFQYWPDQVPPGYTRFLQTFVTERMAPTIILPQSWGSDDVERRYYERMEARNKIIREMHLSPIDPWNVERWLRGTL